MRCDAMRCDSTAVRCGVRLRLARSEWLNSALEMELTFLGAANTHNKIEPNTLADSLSSGVLLCRLLHSLFAGTSPLKHADVRAGAADVQYCVANIQSFLECAA